jgi:hypothetical protein
MQYRKIVYVCSDMHTILINSLCRQNMLLSKGKGKGHSRTGHEGPEGSSTLPLTLAQDGVGCQRQAPAALPRVIGVWGEPQGRYGRVGKNSTPPRFDPRTVQLEASRY